MKEKIINYFITELHESKTRAEEMYRKLEKYPDILREFTFWLINRKFKTDNPIIVEGYTADKLVQTTFLEPIGAYNYLVFLRDKPEKALLYLKKGLPRK